MVKEAASVTVYASKTLPKRDSVRVRKKPPMRAFKSVPFLTVFLPVGPLRNLTLDEVDLETEDKKSMVKMVENSNQKHLL